MVKNKAYFHLENGAKQTAKALGFEQTIQEYIRNMEMGVDTKHNKVTLLGEMMQPFMIHPLYIEL